MRSKYAMEYLIVKFTACMIDVTHATTDHLMGQWNVMHEKLTDVICGMKYGRYIRLVDIW